MIALPQIGVRSSYSGKTAGYGSHKAVCLSAGSRTNTTAASRPFTE
jgi:hypothetical protein